MRVLKNKKLREMPKYEGTLPLPYRLLNAAGMLGVLHRYL